MAATYFRRTYRDLVGQIIDRMSQEGYITSSPELDAEREHRQGRGGGHGPDQPPVTAVAFEVTEKTLDFLGYRALRDLLCRPHAPTWCIEKQERQGTFLFRVDT